MTDLLPRPASRRHFPGAARRADAPKTRQARHFGLSLALTAGALATLAGCATPLTDQPSRELRHSVMRSIERELAEAERLPGSVELERNANVDVLELSEDALIENAKNSGPRSYVGVRPPLGESLTGRPVETVSLSLERAIATAVEHNLSVQFARITPAISRSQGVAADAAFDWVFFSSAQWNQTDEQARGSTSVFAPASTTFNRFEGVNLEAGVRRRLTTGADVSVSTTYQYTNDQNPRGTSVAPDPAHEANIVLQVDQPLLRGFGSDVNLADVYLSRNAERDDILSLKVELLATVTDTEGAYWDLAQAWANLQILNRLYVRGGEVAVKLKNRTNLDTTGAQFAAAKAREEQRKTGVINAQRSLRAASDRLKLLINDPDLPIGSEVLLIPAQAPTDQPVAFNKLDCFLTGLEARPEIGRALLAVDNAGIRVRVAENATLPLLDFRGSVAFTGLESNEGDAYQTAFEGQFVNFVLGVFFEQPIGNRAAQAGSDIRRLERMQAVIAFQNAVRTVVGEITSSLADLATNHKLISQTQVARVAAAELVRTRLVEEELTTALSPEFLNLKLNDQESLAQREQEEIAALINYNRSVAQLQRAMGTALERNRIGFDVPDGERTGSLAPFYPFLRHALEPSESGNVGAGRATPASPDEGDERTDNAPGEPAPSDGPQMVPGRALTPSGGPDTQP